MDNEVNDNKESLTTSSYSSKISISKSNNKNSATSRIDHSSKIEIIYDEEKIFDTVLDTASEAYASLDVCADGQSAAVTIKTLPIKNTYLNLRKRNVHIRYITEITKENVHYCKQMLDDGLISESRHLDRIKGNFAVIDKRTYLATSKVEMGKPLTEYISSNARGFVEQQQFFFDTLWDKAIPADLRIKEIEEGILREGIEVITNISEIKEIYFDLIEKSKEEILIIFPSVNAIYRQKRLGIIDLLKQKVIEGIGVRILTPIIEDINEIFSLDYSVSTDKLNVENRKSVTYRKCFLIREVSQQQEIKSTILIVDKKYVLTIELKDDSKSDFENAIGLSTYSNSKPRVLSYLSIFENFWHQTELYEKLKVSEKMQKDFINIAAHELRSPVQSIVGYTQLAMSDSRYMQFDREHEGFIDAISRNAKRLHKLTEEILDLAKIENQQLKLKKEQFNVIEIITQIIQDLQQNNNNNTLHIQGQLIEKAIENQNVDSIIVTADKERISQVLYNILDNAIKFTKTIKGSIISIIVKITSELKNKEVIVSVKDTGQGIDKDVISNLFTKFTSKSAKGTGLGLFISKNIIEAHGGRIWAENNKDGKGATFSFSLPVK